MSAASDKAAADKEAAKGASTASVAADKAAADSSAKEKGSATASIKAAVGDRIELTLDFRDKDGRSMPARPKLDAPPDWTVAPTVEETPVSGALTVSPDGLSAADVIIRPGSDRIAATFSIKGAQYSACKNVVAEDLSAVQELEPEEFTSAVLLVVDKGSQPDKK